MLDNALGYALDQSGAAQFGLVYDKRNPFEFALDYAVVTPRGSAERPAGEAVFRPSGHDRPEALERNERGFHASERQRLSREQLPDERLHAVPDRLRVRSRSSRKGSTRRRPQPRT